MANPYLLLAGVLFALGLFGTGISIGVKWERNDTLAKLAVAQDTAIKAANAAVEAEIKRSVAAAKAEADARIKAGQIRSRGEIDALKKSRAACARDTDSMGLLHESIDNANGSTPTASIVRVPVRFDATSFGRVGTFAEKLGISINGGLRPVPETPR